MPVRATQLNAFLPSVDHVRHYLPKIKAAVGRNHNLFPLPVFTEADVARGNPQYSHIAATQLAQLIVNSQLKMSGRNSAVAKAILRGFVTWLDTKNYTYTSTTGNRLADERGMNGYLDRYEQYNLFANPSAPIGDCLTTANALALLLAMNGFPCNELMLVALQADVGNSFVFRGGKAAKNHMVAPIDPKALAPLVRVGPGKGLERVPAAEADTPFENHWVVQYEGDFYDANYRAIYRNPEDLFAETSNPVVFAGFNGADMNRVFLPDGKVKVSLRVPEQQRIFFQLEEPASLLSKACPSLSGYTHTSVFLVDDVAAAGDDDVMLGRQQISHKHAKLFGWCVPDEPAAIKRRLMNAVEAYDLSVTGKWLRISTDASKDFCRKSRKWCDTTGVFLNDNTRTNRIYSGVNWDRIPSWRTVDEAKTAIYNAMGRTSTVGTTLRSNLCDAFELPGYLRPA